MFIEFETPWEFFVKKSLCTYVVDLVYKKSLKNSSFGINIRTFWPLLITWRFQNSICFTKWGFLKRLKLENIPFSLHRNILSRGCNCLRAFHKMERLLDVPFGGHAWGPYPKKIILSASSLLHTYVFIKKWLGLFTEYFLKLTWHFGFSTSFTGPLLFTYA